jgi:hypothetical protein
MKYSLRSLARLGLLCLVAFALAAAVLACGWYLERLNVRDMREKAEENMRAYLQEVAKNNSIRNAPNPPKP